MSESPATHLPPCPCCKLPAQQFITAYGFVSYQCVNENCEAFPATAYHPNEPDARTEWLQIAATNQPKEGLPMAARQPQPQPRP